ncbi:HpcH/HpaI aldolase/citrate lyase family protein [Colletotrichum somersetense]|nr:HpcH/HpaI aldolase/citrate lyase family protein [Colletotrichum somersetense]
MLDAKDYGALDLAQPTHFRAMLASGELLWGTSCRTPSEETARIVATLPHHFCFIDSEHSPLNSTLLVGMVRAIQHYSAGNMFPFVRIAPSLPDLITYTLNAGAGGIVIPHVQNAVQAADMVRIAKVPPVGDRSYPPMTLLGRQARTRPGQTVYDVWKEHAALFVHIEDVEGVKNIDEIARAPGIDAIMVGVGDLRCSLDLEVGIQDGDEPIFLDALNKIQMAAQANGLAVLGFAMTRQILRRRLQRGWGAFIVHSDGYEIFRSGNESLEEGFQLSEQLIQEGVKRRTGE